MVDDINVLLDPAIDGGVDAFLVTGVELVTVERRDQCMVWLRYDLIDRS